MVKYPLQSMVGGALLLTLAFSLNDGTVAQSETSLHRIRLACGSLPAGQNPAPDFLDWTPVLHCVERDSKK